MKTVLTTIAGTAVVAAGLMLAGTANAAPVGPSNASDIVMQLQARGNTVIVNRTGTEPLSECIVTGVREGQTYTRYDSGFPGAQMDPMSQVVSMTVYVDAKC